MATKGREIAGHKREGGERDEERVDRVERDEEGWVERRMERGGQLGGGMERD